MSLVDTTSTVGRDPAAIANFTEFLESEYEDDLERFPETSDESFYINWEVLDDWNHDLAKKVEDNPETYLYHLETAVREFDDSIDGLDKAALRLTHHDRVIPVRNIRASEVNELISVEGIVSKATEVKPKLRLAVFRCIDCGESYSVIQADEELEKPNGCGACDSGANQLEVELNRSEMIDYQKVQVQEPPEDIDGGDNPQAIDVVILGGETGAVTPGDRVTATGILRGKLVQAGQRGEKSVMQTHIQGLNIHQEEQDFEELVISDEDVEAIREIANDPEAYEKLTASIAPSIFGYEDEKLAMALQLFSGVAKSVDDGNTRLRGDMHILFVGDPGTGKSQLIRYVKQLSPRGVFTSGKGSSSAGLTAAAVRDSEFGGNDKWTLQAGALVLADKGIACVDELDKMRKEDRSALHEALEQQTVSVNKAGINATLKSRCSLLAAANPEEGRFDEYYSVPDQINLEPPLISRFDLIFIVKDKPDADEDDNIASHILKTNRAGQKNALENSTTVDVDTDTLDTGKDENSEEVQQVVPTPLFRKYVAYARKNCIPQMTDEAEKLIREFYVNLRENGEDNETISITARKLESIVRLSEASARVRLSETIETEDAKRAIDLTKYSLRQVGTDPDTGEFDIDMVEAGSSSSQRERKMSVTELLTKMVEESDEEIAGQKCVEIDNFLDAAEGVGLEREKTDKTINKMIAKGDVIEPRDGYIKIM